MAKSLLLEIRSLNQRIVTTITESWEGRSILKW